MLVDTRDEGIMTHGGIRRQESVGHSGTSTELGSSNLLRRVGPVWGRYPGSAT